MRTATVDIGLEAPDWFFNQNPQQQTCQVKGRHGVFTLDESAPPLVSSGIKRIYRGSYLGFDGFERDAIAIVFAKDQSRRFGMEAATLARNAQLDVGPHVFELTSGSLGADDAPDSPIIIEEDAGVSLEDALMNGCLVPGPYPHALHALGTPERSQENAKILFDVYAQASILHSNAIFHRDLRAANVCVKRYGPNPADIRATLIDFEMSSGLVAAEPEARAKTYYDVLFCEGPMRSGAAHEQIPDSLQVDMGYLAALRYEVSTGNSIVLARTSDLIVGEWPYFSYGSDGCLLAHMLTYEDDIEPLARTAGLLEVNEESFPDPAARSWLGEHVHRFGFLDAYDLQAYEVSRSIYGYTDKIAHEIFRRYKEHVISEGRTPEYEAYEDQPETLQESNCEQARGIIAKAEMLGCRILPAELVAEHDRVAAFKPEEVEYLAFIEHRRWVKERTGAGWTSGPRNAEAKTTPYLVPYSELEERVKDYDRQPVRDIIPLLENVGLALTR